MPENRRLETEKKRAEEAFTVVNAMKDMPIAKKYKSLVKKSPARIKNSGLGETIAFIFSKRKPSNQFDNLYSQISERLQKTGYVKASLEFMEQIVTMDKSLYRSATNETLVYLTWLKRFAEGLIQGEEDEKDED